MADFVDPGLNAVLNVLGAADTGLNIGDLVGQISNIFASFVNMARGFGQWIMGAFKIVQNTLTKIFMAIGFAGLISFIIGLITVMINGIQPWAKALRAHLDCAAHQYNTGWRNQGYILSVLAPCTWEKFLTFINGSCTRYYIVDLVFGLLYGVFIELPIVLIKAVTTIDLKIFVTMFWEIFIVPLDSLFYAITGYHFIKWSDSVINRCYRCKGKYKFSNGQSVTIYKTWDEWAYLFKCGHEQIVEGGMRIFTSLLPTNKWWEWSNRRHMYPPDWNPKVFGY